MSIVLPKRADNNPHFLDFLCHRPILEKAKICYPLQVDGPESPQRRGKEKFVTPCTVQDARS